MKRRDFLKAFITIPITGVAVTSQSSEPIGSDLKRIRDELKVLSKEQRQQILNQEDQIYHAKIYLDIAVFLVFYRDEFLWLDYPFIRRLSKTTMNHKAEEGLDVLFRWLCEQVYSSSPNQYGLGHYTGLNDCCAGVEAKGDQIYWYGKHGKECVIRECGYGPQFEIQYTRV